MSWKNAYAVAGLTPADIRFLRVVEQVERISLVCSLTTASDTIEFERNTPNHVHAMKTAIEWGEERKEIRPNHILSLHRAIFPHGGQWRTSDTWISGSDVLPAPHKALPVTMLLFCDDLHWWLTSDNEPYIILAHTHLAFSHIHPFSDGNGRVGRMILNYAAAYLRLPCVCIADREQYIDLLEENNEEKLAQFIRQSSLKGDTIC